MKQVGPQQPPSASAVGTTLQMLPPEVLGHIALFAGAECVRCLSQTMRAFRRVLTDVRNASEAFALANGSRSIWRAWPALRLPSDCGGVSLLPENLQPPMHLVNLMNKYGGFLDVTVTAPQVFSKIITSLSPNKLRLSIFGSEVGGVLEVLSKFNTKVESLNLSVSSPEILRSIETIAGLKALFLWDCSGTYVPFRDLCASKTLQTIFIYHPESHSLFELFKDQPWLRDTNLHRIELHCLPRNLFLEVKAYLGVYGRKYEFAKNWAVHLDTVLLNVILTNSSC
ncbi:hypothetical protein HDU83_004814 [Entophlyctis luteolus]|nr:hypothetical protein HDU83_004814 [Entophlyctis luteolus]